MEDCLNGNESSVKIYWTKDYGKFRFLKGNRDLDETKIKRILKSVENGLEFFKYCPIMINQDGYVIDGQHRFFVCKKLGLNIYYVIVPEFTLRQVAEMNNNASKWKDRDYLNCYVDVGIEDYIQLQKFIDEQKIGIGIAISLLQNQNAHGNAEVRESFRDGAFRIKHYDYAVGIMEIINRFHPFCATYHTRSFIEALEQIMEGHEHAAIIDELIAKLEKHNLVIEQRSTAKEYLAHLEDLFNFRNSKRRRIY